MLSVRKLLKNTSAGLMLFIATILPSDLKIPIRPYPNNHGNPRDQHSLYITDRSNFLTRIPVPIKKGTIITYAVKAAQNPQYYIVTP